MFETYTIEYWMAKIRLLPVNLPQALISWREHTLESFNSGYSPTFHPRSDLMSVKIAVSDPDDLFFSRITNAIVVCDMVMSTLTLPLQFIILYVLIKDKEYSGSFFTIYKVLYSSRWL